MKKLLLTTLLVPGLAIAQNVPFLRNDNAATDLTNNNREVSRAAVDAKGRLFVLPDGGITYSLISAATNNASVVKASAGSVYSILACNINAAARYLKLYNKATAPTCGTDVPVLRITLPASGCASFPTPIGGAFSTGIVS